MVSFWSVAPCRNSIKFKEKRCHGRIHLMYSIQLRPSVEHHPPHWIFNGKRKEEAFATNLLRPVNMIHKRWYQKLTQQSFQTPDWTPAHWCSSRPLQPFWGVQSLNLSSWLGIFLEVTHGFQPIRSGSLEKRWWKTRQKWSQSPKHDLMFRTNWILTNCTPTLQPP